MKYDDASWHYGGEFPKGLPAEAGATHIGMFVSWCLLNGLGGSVHFTDLADLLEKLKAREITPGRHFIMACDEKFWDQDLSDEGNRFAADYYDLSGGEYVLDYERTVCDKRKSIYEVPDTWATYDKLAAVITRRYEDWKKTG